MMQQGWIMREKKIECARKLREVFRGKRFKMETQNQKNRTRCKETLKMKRYRDKKKTRTEKRLRLK